MSLSDCILVSRSESRSYPPDALRWRGNDGGLLDLEYNLNGFRPDDGEQGLWRYHDVLPLQDLQHRVSFGEGMTPVVTEKISGNECQLKLEYIFPTGSYKDRGATVLISHIREMNMKRIVEDSSGNAGCSIAAYAAKAGIACEIVVAASTSPAKIHQLKAYGAEVTLVNGSREDVAHVAMEKAYTTCYASHVYNPYFFQGTKTFAYEIAEQCRNHFPRQIVLPVGNGTLLIGAWIGFSELLHLGLIPFMPRLIAVQATHCAPLASDKYPFLPTLAEGIAIREPARKHQLLDIVGRTGGEVITVSEDEIAAAWQEAAGRGYYIEKTSAAGWAGIKHLKNRELTLLALTGHGLKNC